MVAAKPPRLRAACTNCHAAKVRCSGERTGCSRCRLHGLGCDYRVSMVGRAPKRRALRAGITAGAEALGRPTIDQDCEASASAGAETSASGGGSTDGGSPVLYGTDEYPVRWGVFAALRAGQSFPEKAAADSAQDEPAPLPFGMLLADLDPSILLDQLNTNHPDRSPEPPFTPPALSAFDLSEPLPNDILSSLPTIPSGPGSTTTDSSASATTASTIQSSLASKVSERVPTLLRDWSLDGSLGRAASIMTLIQSLETVVQHYSDVERRGDAVSHDEVVRQARLAMTQVDEFVDTEYFKHCNACGALVATVADLVAGVYELIGIDWGLWAGRGGGGGWHQDPNGGGITPTEPTDAAFEDEAITPKVPQFSFGCLELEPEEQELLRRQLMQRDLCRYSILVQKCARISREIGWAGGVRPVTSGRWSGVINTFGSAVQEAWYADMQQNAQRLLKLAAFPTLKG